MRTFRKPGVQTHLVVDNLKWPDKGTALSMLHACCVDAVGDITSPPCLVENRAHTV